MYKSGECSAQQRVPAESHDRVLMMLVLIFGPQINVPVRGLKWTVRHKNRGQRFVLPLLTMLVVIFCPQIEMPARGLKWTIPNKNQRQRFVLPPPRYSHYSPRTTGR